MPPGGLILIIPGQRKEDVAVSLCVNMNSQSAYSICFNSGAVLNQDEELHAVPDSDIVVLSNRTMQHS